MCSDDAAPCRTDLPPALTFSSCIWSNQGHTQTNSGIGHILAKFVWRATKDLCPCLCSTHVVPTLSRQRSFNGAQLGCTELCTILELAKTKGARLLCLITTSSMQTHLLDTCMFSLCAWNSGQDTSACIYASSTMNQPHAVGH